MVYVAAGCRPTRAPARPNARTPVQELHKSVLQQAFIGLLRSPVRLDRPEAAATILPETFGGDGGRLAAARDDVDRVALVATLCVLVRQVCVCVCVCVCLCVCLCGCIVRVP